ncbi:MAG: hypothetical protein ACREQC_02565, partial [Candidatus Binataceae bacterium]
ALAPLTIVVAATKCDKLRRAERTAALKPFAAHGLEPILCSAESGEGLEELRRRIITIGRSLQPVSG